MAIRMLYQQGLSIPILVCDHCQRRIEKASDGIECTAGIEIEQIEHVMADGNMSNVFHVHKGECDQALRSKIGKGGWDELHLHFYRLMLNVGLTFDDLKRARRDHELEAG